MSTSLYRNAYKAKDWQAAQFEHLLKFDDFCNRHNLKYSLDFGSLIGAIRHRGYIPWDNDIDVCMLQSEYDRLIDIAKSGDVPERCRFLDRRIDPHYQGVFGRFIDESTSCLIDRLGWMDDHAGLFVDIFALRPLPDDQQEREKAIIDFLVYEEAICKIKRRAGNRTTAFKKRYLHFLAMRKLFGEKRAVEWIRKKADEPLSLEDSKWVMINSGGWFNGFPIRKREWVESVERVSVNGHMLPVFTGYLEILRNDYGDSWRYWPKEEQEFEPYDSNLNIPMSYFAHDYFQTFNQKTAIEDLVKYRNIAIEDMMVRSHYSPDLYKMHGLIAVTHAQTMLENIDLSDFSQRHNESGLIGEAQIIASAFSDYYTAQTSERCRYWNAAIPLIPEMLVGALWALLIARNDYWTAHQIISLNIHDERTNQLIDKEYLNPIAAIVSHISDMHLAMDRDDVEAVSAHLKYIEEHCPDAHDRRLGSIWLASRSANPKQALSDSRFLEDRSIEKDDGEFLLYWADTLNRAGKVDAAKALWIEAQSKTSNGMVQLALQDRLSKGE